MSDSQGSDSRPRFSPRVTEIDTQNPSQPRSVRAKRNRLVLVASFSGNWYRNARLDKFPVRRQNHRN